MGLGVLYTISLVDTFSFVLLVTTLNAYVMRSLEGSQLFLGILGSVSALINLIWNPITGSLGDRLGRKTVLFRCLFMPLVGNILTASSSSLAVFFFARILATFGTPIGVLIKALVDDNVHDKDAKMAAINKMQALGGIVFIFGSLVSGFLSELNNGYTHIWYLISALMAINIVLVCLFVQNQPLTKKSKSAPLSPFGEVTKTLTDLKKIDWPKYWDLFAIKLVVDFVLIIFNFNFTTVIMNRYGITGKQFGFVFSSVSVAGIIASLAMPKVKKYFYSYDDSGLKRLCHGCFLFIYAFLGLGLSSNFFLFYIHLLPFPMGRVWFESTFTEVILARAGPQEKGGLMGALESTLFLAGLIAPILSGFLSDLWGNDTVFLLCIIPLALAAVLAHFQRKVVARLSTVEKKKL